MNAAWEPPGQWPAGPAVQPDRPRRRPEIGIVSTICAGVVVTSVAFTAAARESSPTADCRADALTMRVAVEAYQTLHDGPPASEQALVSGGLLRERSGLHDLVDGEIVPAPTSPCETPPMRVFAGRTDVEMASSVPPSTTAPPVATNTSAVTTTTLDSDDDTCATVSAVIVKVSSLDAEDVGRMVAELESSSAMFREARSRADRLLRYDLDTLALTADEFARLVSNLDEARSTVDVETAGVVSEVIDAIPDFMRAVFARETLTVTASALDEACTLPWGGRPADAGVYRMDAALDRFVATDLVADPRFAWLTELSETLDPDRGAEPTSAHAAAFYDCLGDTTAASYGDNSGCDALHGHCADGNMLACNDLYYSSNLASEYEQFGATCGDRAGSGDPAFAGFCEELES